MKKLLQFQFYIDERTVGLQFQFQFQFQIHMQNGTWNLIWVPVLKIRPSSSSVLGNPGSRTGV
jgi:hypothetical protein